MNKLRGTGATFSTSGKRWHPFRLDRKVTTQNAKRHRLVASGASGNMSKAELRAEAERAFQSHLIHRIPAGRTSRSK